MRPKFIALARVSSREQEREGFSLDVQVDALTAYAERLDGEIVRMYRIAETASKTDERRMFRELLSDARESAEVIQGVLFYKVDRAARNLFDYVELEKLELETGLQVIYVAQTTENTPAGRMQRRILANMASFYTEQQSVDVREGMARRVKEGLFAGRAPFGYRNVRRNGRSLVEVDEEQAATVREIFEFYACHSHTIDSLREELAKREIHYSPTEPRFGRSKVHHILRDRAYIGEVRYRGQWYPGNHPAIVSSTVWERVQALLGAKIYRSHDLAYGSNLVRCGHCGRAVTGEQIRKSTKYGEKRYVYYRCSGYSAKGHPRVRVTESAFDEVMLEVFERIRIEDDSVRTWFLKVLRQKAKAVQTRAAVHDKELRGGLSRARQQGDKLLNLRLSDEIDAETFSAKNAELQRRIEKLKLQIDCTDKGKSEHARQPQKCLNFHKGLARSGLAPMPRRNAIYSKSWV